MARSTRSVGSWLPVVLLLLAVGPNYVLSATCSDSLMKCLGIFSDLSTSVGSADDVSAFCMSAIQNLTACVEAAKRDCKDEANMESTVSNLEQQLAVFKTNICGPDGMCSLKVAKCTKSMGMLFGPGADSSPTNVTDIMQICTLYPGIKSCMDNLGDNCRNKPEVQQMASYMTMLSTNCGHLTNKGKCPDALSCFSSLMSSRESPDMCTPLINVLECLKMKAQLETCTLDESQISFQEVKKMMSEVCPEADMDCEAASKCMEPPGLPNPSGDQDSMPTMIPHLADPGFYCRFMSEAARCYMEKKEECGYTDEYNMKMKTRREELKEKCPAAPSGNAARMSPGVFCFLMAVFTTLLSIYSRP